MAMIHPQVMTVQPISVKTTTTYEGMEMWSSSLFSCCEDMGICCLGSFLPCVLACQVSSDHGEGLCLPLLDACIPLPYMLSSLVPTIALGLRISVRERYHIKGSICDDCCTVTFCTTCSYCQLARELKERRKRQVCQITATTVQVSTNPPAYAPQYTSQYPSQYPSPYPDAQPQ